MSGEMCKVDGCDRAAAVRGWCGGHYQRQYHGRPVAGPIRSVGHPVMCPVCWQTVRYLRRVPHHHDTTGARLCPMSGHTLSEAMVSDE